LINQRLRWSTQVKKQIKLMDAAPKIPQLEGAVFDMGKKESFIDEKKEVP